MTSGTPFEMKKSSSTLQLKIKRDQVNFIQKEGTSRNSIGRDSLLIKSETINGLIGMSTIQSLLSSR
jgi:hypothetical protein